MQQPDSMTVDQGKARYPMAFLLALLMAEATLALQTAMIYAVVPHLNSVFDGADGVAWIVSAKLLSSAIAAVGAGPLGDLFGHRRILCWSMALTAVGGLVSGLAPSLEFVLFGAVLQGASGTALPLGIALIRERLPSDQVPMSVAILVMAATVSGAAGLVIAGTLSDNLGWASVFLFIAIFAATTLLAIIFAVPTSNPARSRGGDVRLFRGLMFAPGVIGLLLAISKLRDWSYLDHRFWILVSLSCAALYLWARGQMRDPLALMNLRLLGDKRVALTDMCMFLIAIGMMQHPLLLSMFAQQPLVTGTGLGLTAAAAGLVLMPTRLIGLLASPVGGWLTSRTSARATLIAGCLLATAGWTIVYFARSELPLLLFGMLVEAAGFMIAYVAMPVILMAAAPEERSGEILGTYTLCRSIGAALGAQIVMAILAGSRVSIAGTGNTFPDSAAYDGAFLFIVGTCLVATALAIAIPAGVKQQTTV